MISGSLAGRLLTEALAAAPRVSVIGICKNAGKTFTLNQIIRAAVEAGTPLGLVSTGRDGEEQDAITELPKPRIWAPTGAWVATAKAAVAAGSARVDLFRELPLNTPFGPVVIGRVAREGEVLLIGPGSSRRVGEVLGALEAHGAKLSLVDGSFDRIAAAAPAVTGRVVLAAGAAYSASMTQTVSQVRHLLDIFDSPTPPGDLELAVERGLQTGPVSLVTPWGNVIEIPVASALGDPEPIVAAALERPDGFVVLNGALSDRLLLTLVKRRARTPIVVQDPTHVLVDRNLWRRWRRQGGRLYVRRPVRICAVTTNAYSPVGTDYNAPAFHAAIQAIAGRPVFDLQAGLPMP